MEHVFFTYADTLEQLAEKYELNTLFQKVAALKTEMHHFRLRLLFVGAFSAGKSALINAALNRNLLSENQRPETAIASELVYDSREYIEAVKDDQREEYTIELAGEIDVDKYDYLIWHINHELLHRHSDCVIVDMPGFNSGIQCHNNAILRYVGNGNAYILVIDCEDGSVKHNVAEFIHEIKNYDNSAAVIITKTDLRLPTDVEKICESVRSSTSDLFGSNVEIITSGKYDKDAPEKIESLINHIDCSAIFSQEYQSSLYHFTAECLNALDICQKNIQLNTDELDRAIELHTSAGEKLSERLEHERTNLENRFNNEVVPAIISDLQNALYDNEDTLVSALQGSEKNFTMTVNNILRPVLYQSVKEYSENAFNQFLSSFCDTGSFLDDSASEDIRTALERYQALEIKMSELANRLEQTGSIYKVLTTTLAVVTDVIAPWLELVLIFLPEILRLIGKTREKIEIRNKVNNEIIPQITERLRPEILRSVQQIKDRMIEESEKQIHELIDNESEALRIAK